MQYLSGLELAKRDPDWTKKIALCGVLLLSSMCIPFFGQLVVMGFLAVMVQRTARGQEDLLPRLEFQLDYLMRLAGVGFRVLVVQFVWMLVLMPLILGFYGCLAGGAYAGTQMQEQTAGIVSALCSLISFVIFMVLMIPASFALTCAGVRAQVSNDISTGLQFGAAFRMARAMWKELLIGGFITGLVFFGLYLAGIIACGIGALFTIPLGMVIMANFQAHVYREYVARGGEAVQIAHVAEADPVGTSVGPRPQAF